MTNKEIRQQTNKYSIIYDQYTFVMIIIDPSIFTQELYPLDERFWSGLQIKKTKNYNT